MADSTMTTKIKALAGTVAPAGSLIAHYPLEVDGSNAVSGGPSALVVPGAAAGHVVLGGGASSPPNGAGTSTSFDGSAVAQLTRAITGTDPMKLGSAFTASIWLEAMLFTATSYQMFVYTGYSWRINLQGIGGAAAYNAATVYAAGAVSSQGGVNYTAVVANGPATGPGAVTPGTNAAVWSPEYKAILYVYPESYPTPGSSASAGLVSSDQVGFTPGWVNLVWGFTGTEAVLGINGVKNTGLFVNDSVNYLSGGSQPSEGAADTLATPNGTLWIGGTGSTAGFDGNMGHFSLFSCAPSPGLLRGLYEAGGLSEASPVGAPMLENIDPTVASSGTQITCADCGHKMWSNSGSIRTLSDGRVYHSGCYEQRRAGVTAQSLSTTASANSFADRAARVIKFAVDQCTQKYDPNKPFWHNGTFLQTPTEYSATPGTAGYADPRFQVPFGVGCAMLARAGKMGMNSPYVQLAATQMEYCISSQIIEPSLLAPGASSFVSAAGAYPGAVIRGYLGGNHNWVLIGMCQIYLALRKILGSTPTGRATLARWQQCIVAAAQWLVIGAGNVSYNGAGVLQGGESSTPPWPYYPNGNFALRYATGFLLTYYVTGDTIWKTRWSQAIEWAMYPYGVPLNPRGIWSPNNSYDVSALAGPDAVRLVPSSWPGSEGGPAISGTGFAAYECILAIAANSTNPSPANDPTHWQLLTNTVNGVGNTNNQNAWDGYGAVKTAGTASDWSDATGWLGETNIGSDEDYFIVSSTTSPPVLPWAANTLWAPNSLCSQSGNVYKLSIGHSITSAATWAADAANWTQQGLPITVPGKGNPNSDGYQQPGYDGNYTQLQNGDATTAYAISAALGDPQMTLRQIANMLANQSSLYPLVANAGASGTPSGNPAGNPQAAPFTNPTVSGSVQTVWSTSNPGVTSGSGTGQWTVDASPYASGGWCSRKNQALALGHCWVEYAILTGLRPDLNEGFAYGHFESTIEAGLRSSVSSLQTAVSPPNFDGLWPLLLTSTNWPGF